MVPLYLPNGVVGLYWHHFDVRSYGPYIIPELLTVKVGARVVYNEIRGSLDKPGCLEACGLVNHL